MSLIRYLKVTVLLSIYFNELSYCSPIRNLDLSEEKMDTTDGKIGEKSMESETKSEEKVGVSVAQAKNILKIYREISPITSKSISGGKKEGCGEKMAVSEGRTSGTYAPAAHSSLVDYLAQVKN